MTRNTASQEATERASEIKSFRQARQHLDYSVSRARNQTCYDFLLYLPSQTFMTESCLAQSKRRRNEKRLG